MNKLKHFFLLSFFSLFSFFSYSSEENLYAGLSGEDLYSGSIIQVRDSWYMSYILEEDEDFFTTRKANASVKLWFDDSERSYYSSGWSLMVTYDVLLTNSEGLESTILGETLSIDYDPAASYKDIELKKYSDDKYIKIEVNVTGVSAIGLDVENLPLDIHLDAEINVERYYNLDLEEESEVHSDWIDLDGDLSKYEEIGLSWSYVQGAESYDFEWLFVDHPDVTGAPAILSMAGPFNFKNASRVNVLTTNYNISLAYPRGLFLFRVRPVGKKVVGDEIVRVEGKWSLPTFLGDLSEAGSEEKLAYEGLMTGMNWQYQAGFSSEGKKGESFGVYDGSLKPRQSLATNHSDGTLILSQTVYDYLGRPSLSLLPVPEENKGLGFYENRLELGPGEHYDYRNFDVIEDGGSNKIETPDNMNGLGVNDYYSSGTSFGFGADYVADADDYPFARTTFTNDGTGRIKS